MSKTYLTPKGVAVSVAHDQKSGFVLVVNVQSRRKKHPGFINTLKIGKKSFHFDDFDAADRALDDLAAKHQWILL